MGAIFDTACILMQENCDGSDGSCWIYDTEFISEGLVWAGVIVKSFSSLCFLVTYLLYAFKTDKVNMDTIELTVENKSQLETKDIINNISEQTYI